MKHSDVLVIGAGPVGSRAAYKLAGLGYKVTVLEEHENVGDRICCTGILGRECVELFGIPNDCILQEANSAKLFAPSGEFLRISKDEVQAYIVDRAAMDICLAERAKSKGAEYIVNSHVDDVQVSSNGVTVIANRRGDVYSFQGKVVVVANGFASKLPYRLGLGQINDFMVGAQTEVETAGVDEVEIYFSQKIAPGFFAWLVPVSLHRARVGIFSPEKPGAYLKELLRQLDSQGKIHVNDAIISYGGIPLKPIPRSYGERVLIAGDAAGQVKPTTGGGVYYGLLCTDIASEVIHQAFSMDDFSKKRLARYEKLWKEKLGRELKIDYFARKLYNRLSDKRIDRIFEIVKENNIHKSLLESSHLSFDWHGELVLDGLKRLAAWQHLFGKSIPAYLLKSLRGKF